MLHKLTATIHIEHHFSVETGENPVSIAQNELDALTSRIIAGTTEVNGFTIISIEKAV